MILGVIPARAGSKGVANKNMRAVCDRPLIDWTIDAARLSKLLDRTVVSTNDMAIMRWAKACSVDVIARPPDLARDDSPIEDALGHVLENIEADYIVLLQPTSPLRTSSDIDATIQLCLDGAPTAVSVSPMVKPIQWAMGVENRRIVPLFRDFRRRQSFEQAFMPNGAVFCAHTDWFLENNTFYGPETMAYLMPQERAVDIDTEIDLLLADALLRERQRASAYVA